MPRGGKAKIISSKCLQVVGGIMRITKMLMQPDAKAGPTEILIGQMPGSNDIRRERRGQRVHIR